MRSDLAAIETTLNQHFPEVFSTAEVVHSFDCPERSATLFVFFTTDEVSESVVDTESWVKACQATESVFRTIYGDSFELQCAADSMESVDRESNGNILMYLH